MHTNYCILILIIVQNNIKERNHINKLHISIFEQQYMVCFMSSTCGLIPSIVQSSRINFSFIKVGQPRLYETRKEIDVSV